MTETSRYTIFLFVAVVLFSALFHLRMSRPLTEISPKRLAKAVLILQHDAQASTVSLKQLEDTTTLLRDRLAQLRPKVSSPAASTSSSSSTVERAIQDAESYLGPVFAAAADKIDRIASDYVESILHPPPPKTFANNAEANPQAAAYSNRASMDYIRKQQLIAAIENESPQEPVDDMPGPHYVAPPDPWADLSIAEQNLERAKAVIDAFRHSWRGYRQYAFGCDELQPRSQSGKNWNEMEGPENGIGLTVLDALSTMHIMGLKEELEEALHFVKHEMRLDRDVDGSAFESTIRILGSLLSIYELTGERDKKLLDLAVNMGDRLMWAYNTSTGLPHSTVGFRTHRHFNQQWNGGGAVLSEIGTVQLEFRTLSYHTGNPMYDMKVTHLMDLIEANAPDDMLCPCYMTIGTAKWATDHISLGALGDSFYEYLLKQYLLTGKTEKRYRKMFLKAVAGIVDKLLFHSVPSHWAYVAEYRRGETYHKMDHLACFVGGMLALGAMEVKGIRRNETLQLAGELTETCVKMYTRQKTGVSPELVEFPAQQDFVNGPGFYILRPETMESLFYMWRFTKEQKWRDYGWQIFRAINRWCRVESGGYSGLREVNVHKPLRDNLMQSFWLAETLKYTYLLFADDDAIDLDAWVFNTEAHPLRRRDRDPLEVWRAYEKAHGGPPYQPPDVPGVVPTETAAMAAARKQRRGGGPYIPPSDPLGDDTNNETPSEDDGSPFDIVRGMRGLPLPGPKRSQDYLFEWAIAEQSRGVR